MNARKKQKDSNKGITAISVSGYKSLCDECRIEIAPLTVLAGANSSGKSSSIQPLLLLKQTLEASYDPGPLLLNGPNVHLASAEQLLSRISGHDCTKNFKIMLEVNSNQSLSLTFRKKRIQGFELLKMVHKINDEILTLKVGMSENQLRKVIPKVLQGLGIEVRAKPTVESIRWAVGRRRCFLGIGPYPPQKSIDIPSPPIFYTADRFEADIRKLIHVPGLRGNPERAYKRTAIGISFSGTFEDYVASVVNHWQTNRDIRQKKLRQALERLGLTWKVHAKRIDDTQVELHVGRLPRPIRGGSQDMVSIADVGFGVSQTLPVIVALLVAEAGQLVYIEQPEIHLHPRAQVALADILAEAANRGVRVILETHSALLLLAIQTLAAEGMITPNKVKLHWFQRDRNGATKVTSANIDEAGAFGDWPEDFGDVSLTAQSRYLDAAERRQF